MYYSQCFAHRGKRESGKEGAYSCVVLGGARSMDERRRALQVCVCVFCLCACMHACLCCVCCLLMCVVLGGARSMDERFLGGHCRFVCVCVLCVSVCCVLPTHVW